MFASLSDCGTGLDQIDAKTERLLQRRSAMIDGGAVAPQRQWPADKRVDSPQIYDKSVSTVNPPAAALDFEERHPPPDPQKEAAQIADRLRRLQGLTPEDVKQAEALDLEQVFRIAQQSAREYLTSEEDYILAAIRLLVQRHMWSPRLAADSTVTFNGSQNNGAVSHVLDIINQLRVTQRLPFGGQVEARWLWQATENLRNAATGRYTQASQLSVDASIPLLRGGGLVAQEGLIQADRNLIYAARTFERFRRTFLVSIARDYFSLLQQRASIRNQACQLDNLRYLETRQRALYQAGRIPQYDLNNARNNVRRAESTLANLREAYALALDRFKVRLGIPVEKQIQIRQVRLNLPEPQISQQHATQMALTYRLDLQNQRDEVDDSRRGVSNARNDLLPDLNLAAGVTFPTDPGAREGGVVYEPDDAQYNASLTFGLPLDREIERLNLRQATISLAQSRRAFDRFRDDLVLGVRASVREIDRAKFNLLLAEEQVRLTLLRQREQQLKSDQVTTQEQLDSLDALLQAQDARDQAATDLRNAVLDYLVATGQMRVKRDGTFNPLPGMPIDPVTTDMTDDMSLGCPREMLEQTNPQEGPDVGPPAPQPQGPLPPIEAPPPMEIPSGFTPGGAK